MNEYLDFAKDVAKKAGTILIEKYGQTKLLDVVKKDHKGLITEADKASDKLIREAISAVYPDHAILTEESERKEGNEYEWVVDPIEGTNNFRKGFPHCGVSIALKHKGETIVAVVYNPILDEMFFASKDDGAYLEHKGKTKKLSVSGPDSTEMFTFAFATGLFFNRYEEFGRETIGRIEKSGLFNEMRGRMLECTAFELCYVASGRFDAHLNNFAEPWDMVAGKLVVEEAGGLVTQFDKKVGNMPVFLASNGVIHDQLVKIVKDVLGE